jgi:hypothetical protein
MNLITKAPTFHLLSKALAPLSPSLLPLAGFVASVLTLTGLRNSRSGIVGVPTTLEVFFTPIEKVLAEELPACDRLVFVVLDAVILHLKTNLLHYLPAYISDHTTLLTCSEGHHPMEDAYKGSAARDIGSCIRH